MSGNMELAVTLRLLDKLTQPMSRALTIGRRETDSMGKSVSALSRISMNGLVNGINLVSRAATAAERAIKGVKAGVSALQTGAQVTAGIGAGAYVMSRPIGRTMDFDLRLANMSNTAFSNLDKTGRQAGMRELNLAVMNAVRGGGGNRDQAAETLDNLIASGAFAPKDAMNLLPTLQKAATAANANPTELANIGIRGMQTFGIKPNQLGNVIDMAIVAGQQGGFELKDMAKWLPQQMAAAKLSGFNGMEGMAKLLAYNQAAVITAGTKDEAGNNLVNLLAKVNSQDTARDAQKLGINLSGTLAAARGKGINSLDAFVGIVDHVTQSDKKYQALRKKAAKSTGGEQQEALSAQADILEGSAIGKIVQDRQALMALVGIMHNRDYTKAIEAKIDPRTGAAFGAAERNFSLISDTASYKTARLANEKTFAEQDGFGGISQTIGNVASKLADYAQHYPGLTSAIVVATTALTALAAGISAVGLAGLLTRGGGSAAAGAAARVGLGVSAALAGGMPLGELLAAGGATAFGTAAVGVGAAGAAGYGAGWVANEIMDFSLSKMAGRDTSLGSLTYDLLPRGKEPVQAAGASAAGLPLLLTRGGGPAAAGAAGYGVNTLLNNKGMDFGLSKMAGEDSSLGTLIYDLLHREKEPVKVVVDVKNGNIVAAVNESNSRQARRN